MATHPAVHNALQALLQTSSQLALAGELDAAISTLQIAKQFREQLDVTVALVDGLTQREIELAACGAYIDAIKEVRSRTHLGLKETKELVDNFLNKRGIFRSKPGS
jgi:ribosomal protein L7/L12